MTITSTESQIAAPVSQHSGNVISALLATQVARRPDEVAVRHHEQTLTYRQVDDWSGRVAQQMADRGVGAGDLVALAADRGFGPLIGILAAVKVGAGYLGLDPALPTRRQRRMIEDTLPSCVLAERELDRFSTLEAPRVWLTSTPEETEGPILSTVDALSDPKSRTFHIVYTSGTTGDPKGVRISYHSVLNRLEWMWRDHPFGAGSVVLVQKSCSLVASPWELLGGLLKGVASSVLSREEVLDPVLFTDAIERDKITHMFLTPHLISGLVDEAERRGSPTSTPILVCSGADVLPVSTVRRFHRSFPDATLLNLYGMTETASNVAAYDTTSLAEGAQHVPVGFPVAGATITVRDRLHRVLPPGVTGEVWVSGPPLALGYVGKDTTAGDRFVFDDDGTRHYRTGDRGRWQPNGALEIIGRGDNQVKIRGYRVELEEIEATLRKAPNVRDAGAFVTRHQDEPQLAVCVTTTDETTHTAALRGFLRDRLPDFMLPTTVVVLPDLPLSNNGKLDRAALADLASRAESTPHRDFTPADGVELTVTHIWTDILGAAPATPETNFFDSGGHSLLAVRLANRLESTFGRRFTLREILGAPTVLGISALCRVAASAPGATE